uniref:Secreted protein n=1 Tax=Ixodes ricinus TaxID=34613 RepID=A0A6B0USR2_IXORI
MVHRLVITCCCLFCSFSFCVSANFTTIGLLQPFMVCEWFIALMALMAHCRLAYVTKAHPLLCPLPSLSTVHSSMEPKGENMTRTSLSLHSLASMPMNSLRSFLFSLSAGFICIGWCIPGNVFMLWRSFWASRADLRV